MIVIFKRRHKAKLYEAVVGHIVKMNDGKAREMIAIGIVEKYTGDFPPKNKTKIDLKDLNNGKDYRQDKG